jgi:hypothetical protein
MLTLFIVGSFLQRLYFLLIIETLCVNMDLPQVQLSPYYNIIIAFEG